jgi:murein DD-endopeptidase MepM/ murein hydrolase activator NlpD
MEENKKKQAAYKESTTSMGKSVDTAVDNSEKWENQLKDYKEMMGATEEDLRNEAKQFMQKRKDDIEYMKTQLAMSKEEIDKYVSDFDNSEIGQRTNYLVNKYMQPKSDNTKLLKLKKLMSPSAFKLLGDDAEKLQQLIEQGKIKEADYGQYKYVMVEEEVKNQQFDTGGKDIDQRKVVTNRKIEEDKARLDILKEKMSDHAFKLLNNKPDQFPVLLEEGKIKKRIWRDYYTLTNEGEKDLEKMMGEQNRRKENMEKGAASFTFTSTSANTHTFAPASVKLPEDDGPGTSTPNKTAIPKPTFIPETKEEPITNTGMPDPNVSAALSTAETKTIKKDDTSEKSKTSMETSSGFALPTPHNVVTSPYGKRNVKKGSKFHTGADFRAREGEDIKALLPGTVTMSKLIPWGNLVVDHGGFQARYIHNKDILVKSGDTVEKGQVIAKAGGRGRQGPRSYTPHLHLDIIRGGNKIDPELFLHGLDSSWMPQYAPSISPSRQLSAKLGGKTDPKIDKTKPDIEAGDGFMSDVAGWGEGIVRKGISTVTDHYSTKYGDLAEEITSTITDGSVEKAGDKLIKKGATKGITGLTEKALTDKNTFKKVAKVLGDKTMDVLSTTKLIMQNKALRKKLLKKIPGIGNILGIGDFIGDIANADYSDKGFAEKAELFSKKLSLAAIGQLPFVGEDAAEMLNDTVMNIGKEGGILRFAKHGMIAKSPTPVVIGDDPYGEMAVPLRPDLFDNMMDRFGFKERPISMKGLEGITDVFKALVEQIEDVVESKSSVDNKSPEKVQQQQAQQPIIIPINNGQGNTNAGLEGRAQHQLDENYTRTDASIDKLIDKMFKNVCIAFENGLSNHSFKNTTVQSFF